MYTSFNNFEAIAFPEKSSRIPDSEDNTNIEASLTGVGQVSSWVRPDSGNFPEFIITGTASLIVPSGKGIIVSPTQGNIEVSWGQKEITLSLVNSSLITTLGINSAGEVIQLAGNAVQEWVRNHILIGSVVHVNGVIVNAKITPIIYGALPYAIYDFLSLAGCTQIEGGYVSPSSFSKLSLDITPNKFFYLGGNYNSITNTNILNEAGKNRISFYTITGKSQIGELTADVPIKKVNLNGGSTISDIANTTAVATAFRLYRLLDKYFLLLGQKIYSSLSDCVTSAPYEKFIYPTKLSSAKLLGIICVKNTATTLYNSEDAVVIHYANKGEGGSTKYAGFALHFHFTGDGNTTDFWLSGADADEVGRYDVSLETSSGIFTTLEPITQYTIELDTDEVYGYGAWLRLNSAVIEDKKIFIVLRDAQQQGDPRDKALSLQLDLPIFNIETTNVNLEYNHKYGLLCITSGEVSTVTIPEIDPLAVYKFNTGSYFSVQQKDSYPCSIIGESNNITINCPTGFLPQTRAIGAIINVICESADNNVWVLSGDLAVDV